MVGTRTLRSWWSGYRCLNYQPASDRTDIRMFGRNAGYCATPFHDALKAAEKTLIANGYGNVSSVWVPRNCPTGISGRTCQSDGDNCSLHNYGIAVDIDPFGYGNPHFKRAYGDRWDFSDCKITESQVRAVEAIRNTSGEQMFRWLGWAIGDTMHFEAQVPPSRTTVDWDTVPGGVLSQMFVSKGDEGAAVAYWQSILVYDLNEDIGAWGDGSYEGTKPKDGVDGDYGNDFAGGVSRVTGLSGEQIGPMHARIIQKKAFGGPSGGLSKSDADKLYQMKGTIPAHGHAYAPRQHGHTGKVVETKEVTLT